MPAVGAQRFALLLAFLACQAASAQTRELPDFKSLMKAAGPSVVNVISSRSVQTASAAGASAPPSPQDRPRHGLASGFIVSRDGYILTNAHAVADVDDVNVRLADAKREFKAKVIGVDKRSDVALLKVEAEDLPVAKIGSSSRLEPGDWVAAIGSPFGFSNTITAGIVSAKGRSLPDEMYVPFIQTDVALNPGNSGGPLLNLDGEVVGINSLIYSGTGGYMGVSFAIPIEVALEVSRQLKAKGTVTRGRLGIAVQPMTKELARSFRLDEPSGAIIVNVEHGGPADLAGVRVGDVALEWNGEKIDDPNELPRSVAATAPSSLARMTVWREGKRQTLQVRVGEILPEVAVNPREAPRKEEQTRLGVAVRELLPAERQVLGIEYGLMVLEVAQRSGPGSAILPGDVIVGVNQRRFSSRQEFEQLLAGEKEGDMVALLVRRGEAALYVPVELG
ncbi:MAG TPA: Do family serine endopeptidase [Burkholderiales bacterium]